MKVGDKIICKKSMQFEYKKIFENKSYTISYIANNYVYIYDNGGLVFDRYNKTKQHFYDYFYTEKELRKQKLKKLCLKQEIE